MRQSFQLVRLKPDTTDAAGGKNPEPRTLNLEP